MNDELTTSEPSPLVVDKPLGRPKKLVGQPKNLIVQLEKELHVKFKTYCSIRGVKMSELVRDWIETFLGRESNVEMLGIQDKLGDWMKEYTKIPGATLEQVLEKFRELQKQHKEERQDDHSK